MLNIQLLTSRYNTTTYPNLEERADGAPIPLAYGNLHGVIPVCIDTVAKVYKVAGHAIHSIDELRTDTETLLASDFVADLPNGEFSLDPAITPYVNSGSTYYFVLEASYAPNAVNHIKVEAWEVTPAPDIDSWEIDNAGAWTEHNTHSISYQIFGKDALDQPEKLKLNYGGADPGTPAITIALGDANARTRLAQKFIPLSSFYVTRIHLAYRKAGTPSGTIRVAILSAKNPPGEAQVGTKSIATTVKASAFNSAWMNFPQRAPDVSALFADIEGAEKSAATIIDGADMLEDLVVTRLGKSLSILDATALANFKSKRTQEIAAYIDVGDITFGEVIGKLGSSLLFKLIPLHDGTYAPTVYEAGEGDAPHLRDEHFLSFSMRRDFSAVRSNVKIKYAENPGNNEFKVKQADSDVARFVYGTEETLEVETYLKNGADAASLATDYLRMYERPPLEIKFEVRGYGLNKIPGRDKVKITKTNAAYAGGTLNGVLFRIVKITKKRASASTEIIAVRKRHNLKTFGVE